LGRKVYHVWRRNHNHLGEVFIKTFTNKEEARTCAKENKIDFYYTIISSYDLKTHVHLDIWYSFIEDKKEK
jgi:hypothetical protein